MWSYAMEEIIRKICRAWCCVLTPLLLEGGNSENYGNLGKATGVWGECPASKTTEDGVSSVALGRGTTACPASKDEGGRSVQRQRASRIEHSSDLSSVEGRIDALSKTSPQERPISWSLGLGQSQSRDHGHGYYFMSESRSSKYRAIERITSVIFDICASSSQCAAYFFLSFSAVRQDLRTAMRERPVVCQSDRHLCHPTRRRTILFLICTFASQPHGQLRFFWREKNPLLRQSEIVADHSRHAGVCSFMLRNWEEVCVWVGLHICHCG